MRVGKIGMTLGISVAMAALLAAGEGRAAVKTRTVEYTQNGAALQGMLAWDDAREGRRPGVLVAHDWMGEGDFSRRRAEELAKLGYVAFALDIYGKGVRPANGQEAGQLAGKYKGDRALLRARMRAAYDTLKAEPNVDPQRIGVIGYCFGGTAALELARSGADLAGTVTFHGGLDTPTPQDAKNIKGKILVLHGADDPSAPLSQVMDFNKEMKDAGVDYQIVLFGHAVHAFTNPAAGNDNSKGAAYNAKADRRSWQYMTDFFREVFVAR
jgi:dienelactone hydrolase